MDQLTTLPQRDTEKPNTEQGLYQKFAVIRTDGSGDKPGGKHYGCDYFVLDATHDPYAASAIRAYAIACKATHKQLSEDLLKRYPIKPGDYTPQPYPSITISAKQIREVLGFMAEGDDDVEVTICELREGITPRDDDLKPMKPGLYAYDTEYPDEGCIPLFPDAYN